MDVDNISEKWDWKSGNVDHWAGDMIKHVYGGGESQPVGHQGHLLLDSLSLENLDDYIDRELKKASASVTSGFNENHGIIGPDKVIFDVTSNVGSLVIDRDRLGLSSQSNFSSIRANCCVYKGKWQYELMLNSKGVMQVGWATINCKFSQEKGVGDTQDSYAYDGNRVRKWNMSTFKYGEPWLTGDVIGCAIDLDNGTVSFYRNGKFLGEAFNNVRIGPGIAYFPAVSLAYNENLVANFGATPLFYPIEGYSSLQQLPTKDIAKAEKLLSWLEKLLPLYVAVVKVQADSNSSVLVLKSWPPQLEQSKGQILLIASPLMHRLGPILASAFITEACLVPFLFRLCDTKETEHIGYLLDIIWALMEPHELNQCLEYLVLALLTGYRFSPATLDFHLQKRYLRLTLEILKHDITRHYLLKNVLFDKIKFPVLLEVKPFDNEVLNRVIRVVWFDTGNEMTPEERTQKEIYEKSCAAIKTVVREVESIQLQILIHLFDGSYVRQGQSSRMIFLSKFQEFLKENSGGSRVPLVDLCPLPVALAFFHRLISLLRHHSLASGYDLNNICVPTYIFSDGSSDYLEIQRIGGLLSHLIKTFPQALNQIENREKAIKEAKLQSQGDSVESVSSSHKNEELDFSDMLELIDGIIRLYHIAAHRQLEKMCALRDSMHEYITALKEIEKRRDHNQEESDEIQQAKRVFWEKLTEQGRHQGWISSVIYSTDRQTDVYWLFSTILRTLSRASDSGVAFSFVPDFYVEACIKCCNALRNFFLPVSIFEDLPGHNEALIQYGKFLARHFSDSRVVNAELKDSLIHALATFVCYPGTLQALESMDIGSREMMVHALLQPYENRAWAQSNWILIRLWKGCGFAFRYSIPPHLAKRSNQKSSSLETPAYHQKPCPSPLFLDHIRQLLLDNPTVASAFLSSVLSQFNWAFSEFIGMLQEIQNASNRPERVFIDSRQLKICATCFDLALGLLRVIEMVVNLVPVLFTDASRLSSDIFLTRLCQLLCQVLNRITSKSGCFCLVTNMEIPGLEAVDHFPILSAVAGILTSLILNGPSESQETALTALLSEPSFQLTSLDFLLGSDDASDTKQFSLKEYEEVSPEEAEKLEKLLQIVDNRYKMMQQNRTSIDIDDDDVCTICYANHKSALFSPCQHESCRACITLYLLHHKECFFCKAVIETVYSKTGEIIFSASST